MLAALVIALVVGIVVIPIIAVLLSPVFRLAVRLGTGRRIGLSHAAHISAVAGVVAFVVVALLGYLATGLAFFAHPAAEILALAFFTRQMMRVEGGDSIAWDRAVLAAVLYTLALTAVGALVWFLLLRSYLP
jgi:hypothetical protein